MICVCHRCGADISKTSCRECTRIYGSGDCQHFSCLEHGGHYCHACLEQHLREDRILAQRRRSR